MIKLFNFGSNFGLADASPFVLKVDAYMRMAGIEFETVPRLENLRKAPKGKLPFIEDNGEIIADSQMIIEHFKKQPEYDLDKNLTDEQKGIFYLVTKSLDENFYFILLYSRWLLDEGWRASKPAFFGKMPVPLKFFVPDMIRKQVIKSLKGQGISRHSDEEVQHILRRSLQALTNMLGTKQYFSGDRLSSLDATAFAFLAQLILVELDGRYNQIAREYQSLVSYCERINTKFYAT